MKKKLLVTVFVTVIWCLSGTAVFAQSTEDSQEDESDAAADTAPAEPQLSFSGNAKTETGLYVRSGDNAGHFSIAKETLTGTVDASTDKGKVYITGNVFYDAIKAGKTGEESASDGLGADVKEAWYSLNSDLGTSGLTAGIKIGRQITGWGKADVIRITDVLCPQDLTTLNAANYSESRIGVDACKINLSGTYFSADAYWIPVFRPSVLPLENWNPLRRTIVPSSTSFSGVTIPVNVGQIEKPDAKLANCGYAGRLSFWFPAADFSLYGFYGYDDSPITSYTISYDSSDNPTGVTVDGKYYKYGMTGLDAAIPVKQFVLRVESAVFMDRALARKPEKAALEQVSYYRKNRIMALGGIDWIKDEWTVTAQCFDDVVLDYDDTLDRHEHEPGSTLRIMRTFLSETLTLTFDSAINWSEYDSFISLSAEYAVNDQLTLGIEGDGYIEGNDDYSTYGKYKDFSSVSFKGIYRF